MHYCTFSLNQSAPSKPPLAAAASARRVLAVVAVRHALGLASEVRRVLKHAYDGDGEEDGDDRVRERIRSLARGLTRVPGPPTYLLYAAALLALPPPPAGNGGVLRASLGPLMLRETFTALALGLDVLQLVGVSSEAAAGGEAGHKAIGPRRTMPASLSSASLALEVNGSDGWWVSGQPPVVDTLTPVYHHVTDNQRKQAALGVSLLISVLRHWNEAGGLPRRLAAVMLYANFLYLRAGHFPGLKVP